jgi:hypothetical protein
MWAFLPVYLNANFSAGVSASTISSWTFTVIGAGVVGCTVGGIASLHLESAPIAFFPGCLRLALPFVTTRLFASNEHFLIPFGFWGIVVAGSSPKFSSLNARYAPNQFVGSALTIANCVVLTVTIISIQILQKLLSLVEPQFLFLLVLPGPAFGQTAILVQ